MFPQNIHFLVIGQNLDLNLTLPHTSSYFFSCNDCGEEDDIFFLLTLLPVILRAVCQTMK